MKTEEVACRPGQGLRSCRCCGRRLWCRLWDRGLWDQGLWDQGLWDRGMVHGRCTQEGSRDDRTAAARASQNPVHCAGLIKHWR